MSIGQFLALTHNAALLLAIAVLFDVTNNQGRRNGLLNQGITGVILGGAGMALMLTPWRFEPGIIFDTRSVLLGISGLFFGPVSTGIAMALTAALRFAQGGAAWTGILVILMSGLTGLLWNRFRKGPLHEISWRELLAMGFLIHVLMLVCMFTLPPRTALRVVSSIALPVLLIYPAGTCALGLILANRLRREATADTLKKSEERLSKLFHMSPDSMVLIKQSDGRILEVNEKWEELTGYSREETVGRTGLELGIYADLEERERALERMRTLGETKNEELRLLQKDGGEKIVSISGESLDSLPEPSFLYVLRDVTKAKKTELALRQSEERMRQLNETLESKVAERTASLEEVNHELEAFSYSVSHDLRAPLRAINGFATVLTEDLPKPLDPEVQKALSYIRENAVRMHRLIDALLLLSRAGRGPLAKACVDMTALFESAAAELEIMKSARLLIEKLPPAMGDATLLRQVAVNLLSNAAKYSSRAEKPLIEVGSLEKDGRTIYFVKDNGAGFDMKYASKLFRPFQRLHSSTDYSGIGIGLALVQRIITRHGGKMGAEGKPGEGATFWFCV